MQSIVVAASIIATPFASAEPDPVSAATESAPTTQVIQPKGFDVEAYATHIAVILTKAGMEISPNLAQARNLSRRLEANRDQMTPEEMLAMEIRIKSLEDQAFSWIQTVAAQRFFANNPQRLAVFNQVLQDLNSAYKIDVVQGSNEIPIVLRVQVLAKKMTNDPNQFEQVKTEVGEVIVEQYVNTEALYYSTFLAPLNWVISVSAEVDNEFTKKMCEDYSKKEAPPEMP